MPSEALEQALRDIEASQTALKAAEVRVNQALALINEGNGEPPIDPPIEPPIDPPDPPEPEPAPGWPCARPYLGPIKSTNKKVILLHRPATHPALRAFAAIPDLITPVVYGMGSIFRLDGDFDHSSSGMDKHAAKVWANFKQMRWGNAKVLWWDIEGGSCYYKYNITPKEAREKAVAWHAGVMQRIIVLAQKDGVKGFEHGEYNIPSMPILGKESIEGIYTQMRDETQVQLMCPWASFGGPNAYFSGSNAQMADWTRKQWVDRRVTAMKGVRKAFGPTQKIIPAIWSFWFTMEKPPKYPDGDRIVPAGHMKAMCEALLEEGDVDGFIVWTSSGDDDNGPIAARASTRYGEVVEVIRKRGDFVGV